MPRRRGPNQTIDAVHFQKFRLLRHRVMRIDLVPHSLQNSNVAEPCSEREGSGAVFAAPGESGVGVEKKKDDFEMLASNGEVKRSVAGVGPGEVLVGLALVEEKPDDADVSRLDGDMKR